ncbi:MAG: ABC transporter ATP-binding protein [Clostridiales Family XIII bacterium]|jgi:putative ABC transport system ATP-binding protein|nr:ABC transporter ATP-binding protein [Clostridiales Family XIII bacterium]
MSEILLENVGKVYEGGGYRVVALAGVNFRVGDGEMVAITGPSGSGKTTLLNIIGLIDSPTSGTYRYGGRAISEYTPAELAKLRNKAFGFVLQDFALIERYNASQNIKVPLMYSDVPAKEWGGRIDNVLSMVGMSGMQKRLPSQLSGGQRQRVAIARALVNDARCILADEPTGSLDTKTGNEIMEIFSGIRDSGKSVVVVTHDAEVAAMCDRTVRICDGVLGKDVKYVDFCT